jgi:hypothetical protein
MSHSFQLPLVARVANRKRLTRPNLRQCTNHHKPTIAMPFSLGMLWRSHRNQAFYLDQNGDEKKTEKSAVITADEPWLPTVHLFRFSFCPAFPLFLFFIF